MDDYEEKLYKQLGLLIRNERIAQKLTLEELADKLNLTAKGVQRYEKGERKININTLIQISDALNIDYLQLLVDLKSSISDPDSDLDLDFNISALRRYAAYVKSFRKYKDCSNDGQEKINKYIDNVYEMEQAEKEVSSKKTTDNHLSSIPGGKASSSKDNDYLTPVAAHNDDTSEEQIKLMREDLDEL